MVHLQLRHWHEDDVRLLAALHVNLLDGANLERTELSLELRDVRLEINEGLAHKRLNLARRASWRVRRTEDLRVHRSHRRGWVETSVVGANGRGLARKTIHF